MAIARIGRERAPESLSPFFAINALFMLILRKGGGTKRAFPLWETFVPALPLVRADGFRRRWSTRQVSAVYRRFWQYSGQSRRRHQGLKNQMRLLTSAVLAAVALFAFTGTGQTRDAQSVINVMLSELGDRRPQGCPSRWCACYMDTALVRAGLMPHGSNKARDFANYGNEAPPGAVGAIMVMANHVGVVVGECDNGQVQIVSGNYSNQVALGCYSSNRAIAWRAPVRH